jgi:hypothetical protein
MNVALRHRCRNQRCRMKLSAPTENEHHAFCARGCHASFYHSRCLVCEDPMRRKRSNQRLGTGHKACEAEYRRFPRVYEFPVRRVAISDEGPRSDRKMGPKRAYEGDRPPFRCLAHWR